MIHLFFQCYINMADLHPNPNVPQELQYCGICVEPYDDNSHQAKFLTCFHTFCSHCLERLSNREQVHPAIIQCPNCQSDTQLPDNGIGGLQTNFYVTSFQEFSKKLKHQVLPQTSRAAMGTTISQYPTFAWRVK